MTDEKTKDIVCSTHGFMSQGAVYCFTNENIPAYLRALHMPSDGRVLTVGASGDQMFESYLAGASHVDMFDININQRHIIELKNHMIRDLEYERFMDFFFSNLHFFDKEIIKPIYPKFSDGLKSYLSWMDGANATDVFKFSGVHNPDFDANCLSFIASKDSYNQLKSVLPAQISFVQSDISGLSATFNNKYDVILLSNIFDYMYPEESLAEVRYEKFFRQVLLPLSRGNLNPNGGKIAFRYIWGASGIVWHNFLCYFEDRYIRRCGKNQDIGLSVSGFESAIKDYQRDAILTLTRRMR